MEDQNKTNLVDEEENNKNSILESKGADIFFVDDEIKDSNLKKNIQIMK